MEVPRHGGQPQSTWKYLDTGVSPNADWAQPRFDDRGWLAGPAPLGYDPDLPVATPVSFGVDPAHKHVTTWFRRSFVVARAVNHQRLRLRVMRDDGVVVYLNGREVYRDNLPAGPVLPETLALEGIEDEWSYRLISLPSRLVEGTNVLAAQVHQWSTASSDLLFDAELLSTLARGPYLLQVTTNSIVVRWRTHVATVPVVRFGTNSAQLTESAAGPGPAYNHSVLLTNLLPDTRYHYAVEAGGEVLAEGPDLTFRTAPMGPRPTRIWVVGDSGTVTWGEPWAGMARSVRDAYLDHSAATRPADLWLMLGDNAYYQGFDQEFQAAMFDLYNRILPSTPVWSTLGNHEAYSLTPDGRLPYYDIFSVPPLPGTGGVPSGSPRYYSFNYGNIHFVNLDSMLSDRSTNGPMWRWLQQDLAANTQDWLIAFWHHPPYSKGNHDSDNIDGDDPELVEMRENFLPLLESYGVDLVLCGHSHNYERSYLLSGHYGYSRTLMPQMILDAGSGRPGDTGAYRKSQSKPSPNQGTVYIVAGSSGSTTGGPLNHPAMFVSLDELGSVILDVDHQRLEARMLRENGVVADHFTLLNGVPPEPLRMVGTILHGDVLTLRWKSRSGRSYQVERATNLAAPSWSPVGLPITATGMTTSWSTPVQPQAGPLLFRITLVGEL
ncbi:MAG: hypothetical protein RJA22_3322 [Verrucomicrobiota bacterium]